MKIRTHVRHEALTAAIAISGLLLSATIAAAQTPAPLLVDADWLGQHINDRGLVVLHVGTKEDYDAAHVPGARRISEDDVSLPHDMSKMTTELMLELPPIEELRAKLSSLGISDTSRIVVYSGKTVPVQSSTRIIFTLDYLGLGDRTSLLNGGIAAWIRAGRRTSTDAPSFAPGQLTARAPKAVVADSEYVKSIASHSDHRLVDARAPAFYTGVDATMNGVKGHIPGAINIPFSQITDDRQMIDRDKVAAVFQAAGVKPTDTIVAYCHVGQQATAVVFAARLLGHRVLLYDGSFQDWVINVHGPVETK